MLCFVGMIILLRVVSAYPKEALIIFSIAVSVGIAYLVLQIWKKVEAKRRKNAEILAIKTISQVQQRFLSNPYEFEGYVADLFSWLGYKAETTTKTKDTGKDIIMHKDGVKYVVEVKLYGVYNKISREKVQKLHAAKYDSKAQRAVYVTTSEYTKEAREYAERNDIWLIDGIALSQMIDERRQAMLAKTAKD